MDIFEFVSPLRKRKLSNEVVDFGKYVYKENNRESEEMQENKNEIEKENHGSKKKKKKKLKKMVDSSSSGEEKEKEKEREEEKKKEHQNEEEGEEQIGEKRKLRKELKKEKKLKKKSNENDEENDYDEDDENDATYEEDQETYETSLNHLFECLIVSIKTKKKLVESFSGGKEENKEAVKKEFSQGSCRISNCAVNFENFENSVETFKKLKNYQKCGIYWLYMLYKENRNGILADEMGLGKTAQACVFLDFMYKTQELKNKTIIVAPTSLLKNWENEINMWCPFLRDHKIIYYGSLNERKYIAYDIFSPKSKSDNIHLIITSINMLIGKNDINYFRQIKKYDYLIFDEAHFLKNKNSLIYKKLQNRIVFNNKILLTGSPIQNKTEELTNLLLFLMPTIFKEKTINYAMSAFVTMYEQILQQKDNIEVDENFHCYKSIEINEPKMDSGDGYTISEETKNLIKEHLIQTIKNDVKHKESKNKEIILLQLIIEPYILRRSKKHVFVDMPKKHSIIIKLPMTNTQLKMYKGEILARAHHTHKHLEFIQMHANKKELEQLSLILGKKENKADKSNQSKIGKTPKEKQTEDNINMQNVGEGTKLEDVEAEYDEENGNEQNEAEDEETINIEETDEHKDSGIVINKRNDESDYSDTSATSLSKKDSRGKLINALIFILRRICNHPLLHKYYYSVEDIKNIASYFFNNTDQYTDLDLKTVENEFMKISDFDIHLSIKHLISQGDSGLNKYLITKEHILNSSKIHHMMNLVKDIRKKKQKVLIFSQFTTFLDIIEEALLYEFIYDKEDFQQHALHVEKKTNYDNAENQKENVENKKEIKQEKDNQMEDGVENNIKENENVEYNGEKEETEESHDITHSCSSEGDSFKNEIYVRLDGSTSANDRQRMIKKFINDNDVFIFLLSTKAGGVGLNLIAANHVILMDQDWNPHNDRQAEDRVHRLGQKNEVFIYRLCCTNTIEETILRCCKAKLHLDQAFGGNSELLQTALINDALSNVEV